MKKILTMGIFSILQYNLHSPNTKQEQNLVTEKNNDNKELNNMPVKEDLKKLSEHTQKKLKNIREINKNIERINNFFNSTDIFAVITFEYTDQEGNIKIYGIDEREQIYIVNKKDKIKI